MKILISAFLFLSLTSGADAACTASATKGWHNLTVEASSVGPDCAKAVVTLAIRQNASGEALWTESFIASQLLNFSQEPAADAAAMGKALKSWISGESFMASADKLKLDGEFPFKPSENMEKAAFKSYRKDKAELFCFIQGMESGRMVIQKDGTPVEYGIQSFPG